MMEIRQIRGISQIRGDGKNLRVADMCVYIYRLESVMEADYWAHVNSSAVIRFTVAAADALLDFTLPLFFLWSVLLAPHCSGFQLLLCFFFFLVLLLAHIKIILIRLKRQIISELPRISHMLYPDYCLTRVYKAV